MPNEAPPTAPLLPEDPRRLGSYELVGRLGSGGQSVVYLGRAASGELAAVKLMRAAGDTGARRTLTKELAAARKVAAFCTARVFDAGLDGDDCYIATEYIEGPTLLEVIQKAGPRSGGDLHRLAIGTITALTAIHRAGIVHRDFKPANVLISSDGPRVIDFGISRALDSGTAATSGAVGTPSYMAPEQLAGGSLGPTADVFAWAVTMVYATTGHPAFGSDTIPAVMHRILYEEPNLEGVPEPMRGLVSVCLAKDPTARPDAQEILLRLLDHAGPQQASSAEAVLAEGANVAATMDLGHLAAVAGGDTKRVRRRHVPWLIGGVVAAVVVAVGVTMPFVLDSSDGGDGGNGGNASTGGANGTAGGGTTGGAGTDGNPSAPFDPTAYAKAVTQAVDQAKSARFEFTEKTKAGRAVLDSDGFFHLSTKHKAPDYQFWMGCAGQKVTDYVILIGDTGYTRTSAAEAGNTSSFKIGRPISGAAGCAVATAGTVRAAGAPRNIPALLKNATNVHHKTVRQQTAVTGDVVTAKLVGLPVIGSFYKDNATAGPSLKFSMVINSDGKPRKLRITFTGSDPKADMVATTTYSKWGVPDKVKVPTVGR